MMSIQAPQWTGHAISGFQRFNAASRVSRPLSCCVRGGCSDMPMVPGEQYDVAADKLGTGLPRGARVVIIGSTSFWHADSEATCGQVGRLLAAVPDLLLLTGGVEGIGEATGRGFFQARVQAGAVPRVYHVLPHGEQ